MKAYDLAYNMLFHDKLKLVIGNFNVMSNITSKFSKPAGENVHDKASEETVNEWKKRFEITINFIDNLTFDILAIQEATPDFYNMITIHPNLTTQYFYLYKPQDNLLTLVRKSICTDEPFENTVQSFPYSKISSFKLLISNIAINIVNVHLTGDPTKQYERIDILKQLASPNTIIIGDFNESVISLLNNEVMRGFLNTHNYKLENQDDDKMTSYSRYIIRGGKVLGIKQEVDQWEAVDNVLYGSAFIMIDAKIYPEGGLNHKHVPYLPLTHMPPYKYTRNFTGLGWSSDHSCNLYTFIV